MDKLSIDRRSDNMRQIRSKNTKPEIQARQLVRELGYLGYRIHRTDLPGKPDIAWLGRKVAIQVHGCFWHQHDCPVGLRVPKSNVEYWTQKIARNVERDRSHSNYLKMSGWKVLTLWECDFKDPARVKARLKRFLEKAWNAHDKRRQ